MTTASTYTQEGWDFSSVWGIEETVSYPELIDATLPYKPKVDLIITDISVSGSDIHSAPGQSTTITVAVENVGDLSLSSAARIKAYYSTTVPENWEQVTTYAGYVKLSSLAQGTSTSIQITFNMPSVSGDVYFCVKADSELAVSEYSEDNNWSGVLGRAVVSFAGGDGTPSQPFLIADNTQLKSIANATLLYDKAYKLLGDIDMAGEQFDNSIISANQAGTTGKTAIPFTGLFDGAGYTVHNYDIYAPFTYYVGLFGVLGQGATISDLHLRNFTVVGRRGRYFGAIAGESLAEITRCSISSGTIDGGQYSSYVGGLVGQISGDGASISDSYVANVDQIGGAISVGGLCGNALENTSIDGCYVATQGITDSNYTGPIAGSVWGMSITGTYWDSDITIAGDDLTTLAVGRNEASTIEAYSKTTQEMMDKSTFTGWQWDTLWAISSGEYPVILANVDLNNDSTVNLQDLAVMSEMWLYQGVSVADLNRDQSVDMVDFSILADKLE